MIKSLVVLVVLGSAVLGSCTNRSAPPKSERKPYVRGPVASLGDRTTGSGLLVQADPKSREPCGILATVDNETRYLLRSRAGALRSASLEDLREGDTVEIYVSGTVMESCPVQGYASSVILIGE